MEATLYLTLGRYGDIMAGLPIVQHEVAQGRAATVMVSREYADLLDGTSLNRIVWDGSWTKVRAAHTSVLGRFAKIVVLQQHSTDGWPQYHVTDSFVKEMYRLAGVLPRFGKCPLTFDRRDGHREMALLEKWPAGPVVLVSTEGVSSPFLYRNQLLDSLRREFDAFTLLSMDGLRAERIYDLLALYERADCLITTDSAPLHLAQAVPSLPVIALVADRPLPWHGSPAYAGQRLRIRYSEYPARAAEVVATALACLEPAPALGGGQTPSPSRA